MLDRVRDLRVLCFLKRFVWENSLIGKMLFRVQENIHSFIAMYLYPFYSPSLKGDQAEDKTLRSRLFARRMELLIGVSVLLTVTFVLGIGLGGECVTPQPVQWHLLATADVNN